MLVFHLVATTAELKAEKMVVETAAMLVEQMVVTTVVLMAVKMVGKMEMRTAD